MLKILTTNQIREADAYTILHEPIASIDLMERAARKCFEWLSTKFFSIQTEFVICCGSGNNGGDGLAIARMLFQQGYSATAVLVGKADKLNEDCQLSYERLNELHSFALSFFTEIVDLPKIKNGTVIIDALFGSGLSRALETPHNELIDWMNQSAGTIVSIDIPSGMFGEQNPNNKQGKIVNATYSLTFQFPKLPFLLPETGNFVGELVILDIGLHKDFIEKASTNYFFIEKSDIQNLLMKRKLFSHKGNFGHALIVAGSEGKMGAALLSTHACLRIGAGLVTALVPKNGREIIQSILPEAMLFAAEERISASTDLSPFSAVGIGPGLGTSSEAAQSLKWLIQNYHSPVVFDADAINILSENKTWLGFLHNKTVFTPHLKEFERLTEKAQNDFHRLELAKEFASKNNTHLVLKGKYSCIVCPDGTFYFNSTGNPGMAKGGSGDILTGIITGLLAQGYSAKDACLIGVYIHGHAGDIAAAEFSETAMLAGDIIHCLPEAFKSLSK